MFANFIVDTTATFGIDWEDEEKIANIGKATISQRVTVDLTKPMPEVVNVTFAQTFTPDEINISTQPGSWAYKHD